MFKTEFTMAESLKLRSKMIGTLYPELETDGRIAPMGEDGLLALTADIIDFLIEAGIIVGGEIPEPKSNAKSTPSGRARMDDPA